MTEIEAIEAGFARLARAMALPLEKRLWAVEEICDYFGVSDATAYRAILCLPDFPDPIKIEGGPQRWVAGEVIAWAEQQRRAKRRKAA